MYGTIDEYIRQFPLETQVILTRLREIIKESAPDAAEKISWQMPTFVYHGNLIHFAAHKNHIGIYPGPEAIKVFEENLVEYKTSKGAIQIPFNKPLPVELIREIVKFRVLENKKEAGDILK